MREKLIELVGQVQDCGCDVTDVVEMNYVENNVLVDHLIANGVTVQKWIPVTERLPDLELVEAKANDMDIYACLATIKNKRARNGRYVGKVWYDGNIFMDTDCVDITHDVTHWTELPEPPKGE